VSTLAVTLGPEGLWWTNLLVNAGILALLALSLNLINGYGGMFSLGHHGFWAMGAYAAAWLSLRLQGELPGPLVFAASALFAMAVAAVGGLGIGVPCLRLRGDYLAIATLGFGEIVRTAIVNVDAAVLGGAEGLDVPRILMEVNRKSRGDFRLLYVGLTLGLVVLVALAIRNHVRSSRGRALLAVAQDETAASLLGISPTRPKVVAFVLGSALAGLAGALTAHYEGYLDPKQFGLMQTVKVLLVVVLGGLGSLSGCMFAALLLTWTEQRLSRLQGWAYEWWQVEFALLLVLLMIFRPRGLFGSREIGSVVKGWFVRARRAS
jgi:branched-chain amino acid transport system permease protein